MKKLLTVGAILLGIGLVMLTAALLLGLQETEQSIKASQTYSAQGITALVLDGKDSLTVIQSHDQDNILIETDTSQERRFEITQENGVLLIKRLDERKWYQYFGIHITHRDYNLRITLPAELSADLQLTQSAGNLQLSGLHLQGELFAKCSSGSLRATELSATELELTVTSGAIHANTLTSAGEIRIQGSSGAIYATALTAPAAVTVKTNSGSLFAQEIRQAKVVDLEVVSGVIRMQDIQAALEITATSTSGSIRAMNLSAEQLSFSASSGSISLSDITATGRIEAALTSGRISAHRLQTPLFNSRTSSGSQIFEDSTFGSLSAECSSGSIRAENCQLNDSATLRAASGSIKCILKNHREEFTIVTKTTSGSCNLPSGGNGEKQLDISTTSGSISVRFGE